MAPTGTRFPQRYPIIAIKWAPGMQTSKAILSGNTLRSTTRHQSA
jgi:hypothetical protein